MNIPVWLIILVPIAILIMSLALLTLHYANKRTMSELNKHQQTAVKDKSKQRYICQSFVMERHFHLLLIQFLSEYLADADHPAGMVVKTVTVRDIMSTYIDFKSGTLTTNNNLVVAIMVKDLEQYFISHGICDTSLSNVPLIVYCIDTDTDGDERMSFTSHDFLSEVHKLVQHFNNGHESFAH